MSEQKSADATLLVVDDNEANRDMLARRLRRQGYEVETAVDGPQAIEKIEAWVPDLVLLDVMMPGMSGLEVLRYLRNLYDRAELPILMATAKTDSEDVVQALALGANDYVTKPIDFPVLLARVASHLQTRAASGPTSATVLSSDGDAEPGTVLDGRFRVERTVGVGGFAIVFQATQLSTGQSVAVKVLRSQRAIGDAQDDHRRFETEMKLIGRLRHPHVVRLMDYGILEATIPSADTWSEASEPGVPFEDLAGDQTPFNEPSGRRHKKQLPYIVMEYLDGDPLDHLLKRSGPLDAQGAVEMLLPIASAIAEAHRMGIVHRDLKPPNVIVGRGPRDSLHPWVLDFGIARPDDFEDDSFHRREDALIGTPEYMSPEQARGQTTDEKSDQYSLGALLYEVLTGRRPFRERNIADLVQKVSRGLFPKPREIEPSIPEELEEVLLRAMDPLPDRRFSTVESFAKALLPFAPDAVRGRWSGAFAVATDPPPPGQIATIRPLPSPAPLPTIPKVPEAPAAPAAPEPLPTHEPGAQLRRIALGLALVGIAFAAIAAFLLLES